MHDPKSVAFEIRLGKRVKKNGDYREPFITIWHVDPETDGTDDSCGHFMRERHLPAGILESIEKEFRNYYFEWFKENGEPKFSVSGVILQMYSRAAWIIFYLQNNKEVDRKKYKAFMRKHIADILLFAENDTDCVGDYITNRWGINSKESRIENLSRIITCDIFNMQRKWHQQPKWHIKHWEIQFTFFRRLKRRYWDKCSVCGNRGFKRPAHGDWSGKIWHSECDKNRIKETKYE